MISIFKRGNVYQYQFDIAPVEGKRKRVTKSGFKTKAEAEKAGLIAYNDYMNVGQPFKANEMSYSDFLDYWLKTYCEVNLKYRTIESYKTIARIHLKPNLGHYRLNQLTTPCMQEFINKIYVEKAYSKSFLRTILKVLKTSIKYAHEKAQFIQVNPALNVTLPKYDVPPEDPAHILTKEEVNLILDRFKNNHAFYYAVLTAYYTGLRVSEVFGLTWDNIDFENKRITINKTILKKNQAGATHGRHISGTATTVWYFGTCKNQSSYRTIEIGDNLLNALMDYKKEQIENEKEYGTLYMKHYMVETENSYNKKKEIKILNAYKELNVGLPETNLVFVKHNGVFEGTDTCKYPFKVIHYELGIPCRFHDFRDTHATRLIEAGADIKAVSKRLGHSNIRTTYEIYVRVTDKMERVTANLFDEVATL